jgi:hypothetical protein
MFEKSQKFQDESLKAEARARFPNGGFELWQGRRLVRREPRSGA